MIAVVGDIRHRKADKRIFLAASSKAAVGVAVAVHCTFAHYSDPWNTACRGHANVLHRSRIPVASPGKTQKELGKKALKEALWMEIRKRKDDGALSSVSSRKRRPILPY